MGGWWGVVQGNSGTAGSQGCITVGRYWGIKYGSGLERHAMG